MRHSRVWDEIQQLDPERDAARIVRLSGVWDFAWDGQRALEIALLRTFAVPSIGGLLATTGEFTQRTQRRYDDTALLIAEFLEWGYDSPRGRAAIERMNAVHGRFKISQEDFRYVLSTFVVQPIRWNERFGWRSLCPNELRAGVHLWQVVGERMGIHDIPADLDGFMELHDDYERAQFRYTPGGAAVARATIDLFGQWYLPPRLRPLARRAVYALLDVPLLDAFGLPHPTPRERRLVEGALRSRARLLRRLPPRRRPYFFTERRSRSYPHGYDVAALGPPEREPDGELVGGQVDGRAAEAVS